MLQIIDKKYAFRLNFPLHSSATTNFSFLMPNWAPFFSELIKSFLFSFAASPSRLYFFGARFKKRDAERNFPRREWLLVMIVMNPFLREFIRRWLVLSLSARWWRRSERHDINILIAAELDFSAAVWEQWNKALLIASDWVAELLIKVPSSSFCSSS